MRPLALVIPLALILSSCNQNMETVRNGEALSASPKTGCQHQCASARHSHGGDAMPDVPPFVKAYFMHQFVEALYSTPQNFNPNPKWATHAVRSRKRTGVDCTDCHVNTQNRFREDPQGGSIRRWSKR